MLGSLVVISIRDYVVMCLGIFFYSMASGGGESAAQFDISEEVCNVVVHSLISLEVLCLYAFSSIQGCSLSCNLKNHIFIQEKDKLVGEVIRYVLFKTHQGSGCPIKREELTQLITKNYRQRALPAFIINEARSKLSTIFGYEMTELQRSRLSSANQGRASQQSKRLFTSQVNTSYIITLLQPS